MLEFFYINIYNVKRNLKKKLDSGRTGIEVNTRDRIKKSKKK